MPTILVWYLIASLIVTAIWVALGLLYTKRKREAEIEATRGIWIYSGVRIGANNVRSDAGFLSLPRPMTVVEAITQCGKLFPNSSILHVDHENRIITYQI